MCNLYQSTYPSGAFELVLQGDKFVIWIDELPGRVTIYVPKAGSVKTWICWTKATQ